MQEIKQTTMLNNIPTYLEGELDNFTFLLENTKFSSDNNGAWAWWLENARSDSSEDAWFVSGRYRFIGYNSVSIDGDIGVRPVIEVSKTDMNY